MSKGRYDETFAGEDEIRVHEAVLRNEGLKVYKYTLARKLVKVKEIGKNQEWAIQTNNSPDLHVHVILHMGKRQKRKKTSHTRNRRGHAFPSRRPKKDPQKLER